MAEAFAAVEIIAAKRDRHELTDAQIDWVVDAYTRGVVADEQMSALLMAILLNGMNAREISRWTDAMINSGERMSWSALSVPTLINIPLAELATKLRCHLRLLLPHVELQSHNFLVADSAILAEPSIN